MKKVFVIIATGFALLFLVILVTPVLFKSRIVETVKTEINKTITAEVEFNDVKLSLLKSFPDFFFGIYDLSVVGTDHFAKDTLLAFDAVQVDINLRSVLSGDQIEINSVLIDHPAINALILKDGKANYDIMVPSADTIPETDTADAEPEAAFSFGLKEFLIKNATIAYLDEASNMKAYIKNLNFQLDGDFTQDFTAIETELNIQSLDFTMDGIDYLSNAAIQYVAGLDADLKAFKFTFKENIFRINEIELGLDGFVEMPDEAIAMDLKLGLKETTFKDLLSMVPVVYMTDFEDVEANGEFSFNASAKGVYHENKLPAFNVSLLVNNAMFKYPDLPDAVDHINVDLNITNPGGTEDDTKIDLNRFQLRMADNPVNMIMHLKTPISDPEIGAALKTNIDFETLKTIIPSDEMKIKGMLNANLVMNGKLSTLEEERYEDFKADGSLKLKSFSMQMEDLPYNIKIPSASIDFSPKMTRVNNLDLMIGESDFHFKGFVRNYIAWIFDKGVLEGSLSYNSTYINVDEFMVTDTTDKIEEEIPEQDTVPMTVFEVPENIHFTLNTGIDKIKYDKIDITGLTGKIEMVDGKAILKNLKMYLFNGILVTNGEYNTQNPNEPKVALDLQISGFDISAAYSALNTIQKLAPVAKNMHGSFSTSLSFNSLLNQNMEPIYNTIMSDGRLFTQDIELKGGNVMTKIGDALKTNRFKEMEVKDIDINYHIKNGVIEVEPFTVKAKNTAIEIAGKQGIDGTLDYTMFFDLPTASLGAATNNAIASLTGTGTTENNTIGISALVGGFYNDPSIKLERATGKGIVGNIKDNINKKKEEVKDKAKDKIKDTKEAQKKKIIAEADKKANKIVAEAKKTAASIRSEAKKAGERLIVEAEKQGDELVKKAGNNIIKKKIAQESAKKLKREAEKKAEQLNQEADTKAKAVVNEANKKADKIRAEARQKANAL